MCSEIPVSVSYQMIMLVAVIGLTVVNMVKGLEEKGITLRFFPSSMDVYIIPCNIISLGLK